SQSAASWSHISLSIGLTTWSAIWRQRSAFARYSSVLFVIDTHSLEQANVQWRTEFQNGTSYKFGLHGRTFDDQGVGKARAWVRSGQRPKPPNCGVSCLWTGGGRPLWFAPFYFPWLLIRLYVRGR